MMTNCPNCGAPIHGAQCDYCGTIFISAESKPYKVEFEERPAERTLIMEERNVRRYNSDLGMWEWVVEK